MAYAVCMIGNSHVAALKMAWDNRDLGAAGGVGVTFFSAQTNLLEHLTLEKGVLVPGSDAAREKLSFTSGTDGRIAIASFDALVMVGSCFGVNLLRFYRECPTWERRRFVPDAGIVSAACLDAFVAQDMEESIAVRLIETIRKVKAMPVLLVGAPYVSARALDEPEWKDEACLRDEDFLARTAARCRASADRVAARHGCETVWQDDSTVGPPGFTKLEFGRNPARFNMRGFGLPEFDMRHGNEDYGALMMREILTRLDANSGGRVLASREQKLSA
ncbi:MAG TPA: hypothetical protein VG889_14990 [Rhizomicrobium sp.]|nr:hypothetical protein [Rhizomicrobium sp.]